MAPASSWTDPAVDRVRVNRRAGYTAFVWVLVFLAWHVVWYATGLAFPTSSHIHGAARLVHWVADSLIDVMFVAGCVLPLALVQRWGQRLPRRLLLSAAWIATGILALRGVSGIFDDSLRAAGFPRGLTGLSTAETAGTSHVTFWVQFSGVTTDVLFVSGAMVFALAAVAYGRLSRGLLPSLSGTEEHRCEPRRA